jgi:hypothetical protein
MIAAQQLGVTLGDTPASEQPESNHEMPSSPSIDTRQRFLMAAAFAAKGGVSKSLTLVHPIFSKSLCKSRSAATFRFLTGAPD